MKAKFITGICLIFAILLIFLLTKDLHRSYSCTDYAMDTVINITTYGKNSKKAAEYAVNEVKRIDSLMSTSQKTSDIYAINSAKSNTPVYVNKETLELLDKALDISQKTDGAFDITVKPIKDLWNIKSENPRVPENKDIQNALKFIGYKNVILDQKQQTVTLLNGAQIDLGAIAKGYAADCAAKILKENKIKNALIDLGGNVYALGKNSKGEKWNIGIQIPFAKRGEYFHKVKISDKSVVTSGAYERYFKKDGKIYHHIIDPLSGYPAESGVKSSTVVCSNSALADALSTAVFVAGADKAKKFKKSFPDAEFVILDDNDKIIKY